jgi:flagellar biosynthesis protein FlhF
MALDARMATPPAPDPRVHTAAMVERAMVERAMGERAMVEPDTRARAEPAGVLHPPMAMEPAVFRRRPSRLSERPRAHATAPETPAPQPAATPAAAVENVERPKIASDARVMDELRSLRSVLSDRITHLEARIAPLSATVAARASPAAAVADSSAISARAARAALPASRQQALTRLIMSGFSPELARRLAEAVPGDIDPKAVDGWLQSAVGRQIACPEESDNPLFAGGAVALVGPTGVGKTTTIAKLAARFVVRHGAGALGLVTLDSYRIGAHEQLRGYGRILGVPVHSAHDAASLGELLASMHGKHRVLIDTCGMSQRDQRLAEMLAMLEQVRFAGNPIRRVLLINAASHAETIDEVARAWRVEATQGAVLTKIDEAARIGGALDALVRHRLPLLGLTNGQRVPEDWHPGNPLLLAHIALKPLAAAFCLDGEPLHALPGTGVVIA